MYNTGLQTEIHQDKSSLGFTMELIVKLHNIFGCFQQSLVFEEGISHKLQSNVKLLYQIIPAHAHWSFQKKQQ